jgi:hypothetical protein
VRADDATDDDDDDDGARRCARVADERRAILHEL